MEEVSKSRERSQNGRACLSLYEHSKGHFESSSLPVIPTLCLGIVFMTLLKVHTYLKDEEGGPKYFLSLPKYCE